MAESFFDKVYNPDVLSCLANLSNDEVFTPPEIVNQMLDLLPQELFCNPDTKFLDPACKTGVFLREIAKRLIKGLEPQFPDLQQRIDHIFHNQLYGIAITELTSLLSRRGVYCSKYPNSEFSVSKFDTAEGNVRFKKISHTWKDGRCIFCGANKEQYDRDKELESYAYEFIHTLNPEEIFNMKFDVIICNPPYQLKDGGGTGSSAKPIYQHFIYQAKKLQPHYISMIIPSRWYSGGKGLDEFRQEMLEDKHIRALVDYDNFKDAFAGVDLAGGACYFLWDKETTGMCKVSNFTTNGFIVKERYLNEFDTFIRSNTAIDIVKKIIRLHNGNFLDQKISVRLPFGITTNYPFKDKEGVPCYFTQRVGLKYVSEKDFTDNLNILNKWKFLIPKAPIAGQTDFSKPVAFYYDGNTRIAKPQEICSESWLVAGAFDTEKETNYFKSYLLTKTVRFLLLQTVVSQNITRKNFCFIPDLGKYDGYYTDEYLCDLWQISNEEWKLISEKIGEIGD